MSVKDPEDDTLREVFAQFGLKFGVNRVLLEGKIPTDEFEVVKADSGHVVLLYPPDGRGKSLQFNVRSHADAEDRMLAFIRRGAMYRDYARRKTVIIPPFDTVEELKLKLEVANGRA